jgi:DNA-binding NtrC family response regulator
MSSSRRILIVDDNINFCKTMAAILIRKGHEVATAHSGREALHTIKSHPSDIIFLDIKMPSLNGVETYERIKEIDPHATVVMMTGYAVEDLVQKALEEGAHTVLYKPFDFKEVLTLIDSITQHGRNLMILVVDDDHSTCTIFKNLLSKKGYAVNTAHTGEEAIAMSRKEHYDVMFIDMKLPTINGLDTYFSIREHNPQATVVMITAYHREMKELIDEALHNSVYTWFQKPLDMDKIFAILEHICLSKQGVPGNG